MSDFFSTQEDELNIFFDKLSKTISAFPTLSRELAEKAIIETNLKIKEGESIIEKMNDFINNNENNINKEENIELSKKVNNLKNEFNNLVNLFNIAQNKYINKKAESALIDDIEISINHNKHDLIDDESIKNKNEIRKNKNNEESTFQIKDRKPSLHNENTLGFEKNIGNISGVGNNDNNNIPEEVFKNINKKSFKKKKKIFYGVLLILAIVLISVILFLTFLPKKINN